MAASRANIEFHRLLYSNSRNNFLQKTTDSSWLSFRISFLSARNEDVTLVDKSWYEERNNEHLQLIQAIRDKDVEKAIKVNTIHIDVKFFTFLFEPYKALVEVPFPTIALYAFTVSF
ncbi:FCD domain-containing protein [Peribacillus frigoritolerans]|uniref:FCD domain-containing protein n=1 Tax=Peribacillus frigoritolerans TaxID=450367 RepID=UPI0025A08A6C|nr:FCD domain-containing protein [Peribacillus frigoritolerans]MDM5306208.1 FCD domain-containing protein [Peribacillus frigoritolerans]